MGEGVGGGGNLEEERCGTGGAPSVEKDFLGTELDRALTVGFEVGIDFRRKRGMLPLGFSVFAVGVCDLVSKASSTSRRGTGGNLSFNISSSSRGVGGKGRLVVLEDVGDIELRVARLAAETDLANGCEEEDLILNERDCVSLAEHVDDFRDMASDGGRDWLR